MNKISKYDNVVNPVQFGTLIRSIFEDPFEISEDFMKHSECRCELGQEIDLELAKEILDCFKGVHIKPEDLVGTWMMECSRDYSNSIYWSEVSEIIKVEEVTETIVVTKWKPICDETVPICSSQQPQSKVCIPKK
jgi:hypothetical protein